MPTLQNDQLAITVDPKGAELSSVKDLQTGTEYMWVAKPDIWGRHAPVLFPIVGKLKDNQHTYEGRSYPMGQHGFARDLDFQMAGQSSTHLHFRLGSNEETQSRYPFVFTFRIRYDLNGRTVRVSYYIKNNGEEMMPFSVGAHPGFNCPLSPEEKLTDYEILFEQPETAPRHLLEGGLFSGKTQAYLTESTGFPITEDTFNEDALVFHQLASAWVALKSAKHEIRMSLTGFPYLGIWAKPGAPFVCLEPWQGLADYVDSSGQLMDKKGIILLKPGRIHQAGYTVEFN
ncbi:MAG: aldose 1-epimerase family protein [Bacteroidota bacterium]